MSQRAPIHIFVETDLTELRREFAKLLHNGSAIAGDEWIKNVTELAHKASQGQRPTPEQWLNAAKKVLVKCDACRNGTYYWGACVNGQMTHARTCYRCQGKGRQNAADCARNRYYDNHRRII